MLVPAITHAQSKTAKLLDDAGFKQVGDVADTPTVQLPFITWGGDIATFYGNGGLTTKQGSIFDQAGLNFKMVNGDDPVKQVKAYLEGDSPYLRMTYRMAGMFEEELSKDVRTRPFMFYQLTWSAGDHLVFKEPESNLTKNGLIYKVKKPTTLKGLKGLKVALQRNGPHLGFFDDSLNAAGLTWDDVIVVWCKDLTASDDSPIELLRRGEVDAACVITPDMLGLTAGGEVGNGAEGSVRGARIMNSTATMSRSIADVYIVRSDYYRKHTEKVQALFVALIKSTEKLIELKNKYNDGQGNSPEYISTLKMAQQILGEDVLPTIEEDAHGLLLDAKFSRIPGNESFFTDPSNLAGFDAKQKSASKLAVVINKSLGNSLFQKPNFDYKNLSEKAGVKYVKPTFAKGRINAEAIDFTEIDDEPILSFEIRFGVDQVNFDVNQYSEDFEKVAKNAHLFGNAGIIIKGHSDNYRVMKEFYYQAKAKGLITGTAGSRKFKGRRLNLGDIDTILKAVKNENLNHPNLKYPDGKVVGNPRKTVSDALQLSHNRANSVKESLSDFLRQRNLPLTILEQVKPYGVGVAEPAVARPKSNEDTAANRRVEFLVVPLNAEAITKDEDFDFDE
jgi:ABC-type nitrate/sulfonate/bicarbonate transport system substrate-binding protein